MIGAKPMTRHVPLLMPMPFDRQRFIEDMRALARKRTRFLHQGCSDVGMDCINLPRYAFEQQGLEVPFDFGPYYRVTDAVGGERLHAILSANLQPVKTEDAQAGDIYFFRIRRIKQHVAVRIDDAEPPTMVHALREGAREIPLDTTWQARIVEVFRIPDGLGNS